MSEAHVAPIEHPADGQAEKARVLFIQNPLHRPVLYAILRACSEEVWQLEELEVYIQSLAEFKKATQPPFILIQWLKDAKLLDSWGIDHYGADITPERCEGLTPDEIEDLAASTAFKASPTGLLILDEFNPQDRLMHLLNISPARYDTYLEVLEFLQQERPFTELDRLLRGKSVLMDGRAQDEGPMQPSVFVDKLAAAGGIVFREGWIITQEGKELLEKIKAEKGQEN